jgi:heptosyltransferase-2
MAVNNIRRLVVVQPHGLGDLIMATPMLSGLRKIAPELHLTLVAGSREMAELVRKSLICDEVLFYHQLNSGLREKLLLVRRLRQLAPDACLVAPRVSPFKGELIAWIMGARCRVGCQQVLPWVGYNRWNSQTLLVHKVEAYLLLAKQLFPDTELGPISYNLDRSARDKADDLWQSLGFGSAPVLGIHPGCDPLNRHKRYPLPKFKQVIERFMETHSEARGLVFLGPQEDRLYQEMGLSGARLQVAKGNSLQTTARLLERITLLLANDSGLGHLANAMNTPVVSIFGPTDPSITGPWGEKCVAVKLAEPLACQPCLYTPDYGKCEHRSCLESLTVEHVLEELESSWRNTVYPGG